MSDAEADAAGIFAGSAILCIGLLVVSVALAISPLLIWHWTKRTALEIAGLRKLLEERLAAAGPPAASAKSRGRGYALVRCPNCGTSSAVSPGDSGAVCPGCGQPLGQV